MPDLPQGGATVSAARRRVSWGRLLLAVVVVALAVVIVKTWSRSSASASAASGAWFAPYVDLTLTPRGAYPSTGDLLFTNVHLEDDAGRRARIDYLEIEGEWPLFPPQ